MKILLVIITISLLYGLIYGGTQKTKEEQKREDEEQMEFCKKWNEEHKKK